MKDKINNFQDFLLSKGFIKCVVEYKDRKHSCRLATKDDYLSTMGILTFSYLKSVDEFYKYFNERWDWGLHEANKPAILSSPRPNFRYDVNKSFIGLPNDDEMNKILLTYSFEDIYDCVINKKIINVDYKQLE